MLLTDVRSGREKEMQTQLARHSPVEQNGLLFSFPSANAGLFLKYIVNRLQNAFDCAKILLA